MRDYFCGWYFRCQSDAQTLAVIPAIHRTKGEESASVQIITDAASWNVPFPWSAFRETGSGVVIGRNRFEKRGIYLNLDTPEVTASGSLRFGPFTPLPYDIMGPFRFVPFLECRHSVFSMRHTVSGELQINGVPYAFDPGVGYLEGDRGHSFPREYAWTQCSFSDGALVLAVADVPLGRYHFTGVIGVVLWQGRAYRLATYLGAKAVYLRGGELVIEQGSSRLTVKLLEQSGHPLCAPTCGAMSRTIHEHASCRVFYRFQQNHQTLFELEAPNAAFEYEYAR